MGATMEESAVCRFIGKRYTSADSINGGYGHKWGEWWQNKYFAPLEATPHMPLVGDSTVAAMRMDSRALEYWIGFFYPADTAAPEGYEAVKSARNGMPSYGSRATKQWQALQHGSLPALPG
ncbi:MAG: hypothetical protein PUC00_12840 [Clostridiales bacterium]|nr:hypothetical protein [Clostridiales bacterium]